MKGLTHMRKFISIPFNYAFLDIVSRKWMEEIRHQDRPSSGMIILPNQRTAKALINSFIRINQGRPVLLPQILSVGAMDEMGMVLGGRSQLALLPAVHRVKRLSVLTTMIMQRNRYTDNPMQAGAAWNMASSLADLMDEAEWAGCDLYRELPKAVEGDYAQHWQEVLRFLFIVTEMWPQWLADNQMMNPVARRVAILKAQVASWRDSHHADPIWLVGFSDARPAIIDFISAILQLPRGRLVIAGMQEDLSESEWNALPLTHPFFETAKMLSFLGVKRFDFQEWRLQDARRIGEARVSVFEQALLPARNLEKWLVDRQPVSLSGCFLISPLNQQQEAMAIALIIRDALETPGKRIALVTPDRNLAMRVSLELGRWGVIADDSAGEPLYKTAGAVLLNLVLQACIEDFTPVSLLSLLKHPLVCCGVEASLCREYSRLLEIHVLRQFAASGLLTIREALIKKVDEINQLGRPALTTDLAHFLSVAPALVQLLDRLQEITCSLFNGGRRVSLSQWVTDLVKVLELLVSTPQQAGDAILWRAEEGNALAEHLRDMIVETESIQEIDLQEFSSILNASYQGIMVRGRRALRGRKERELHPRVYIWGLLEARLQDVEMVILGGLSEGVWPSVVDPGPWLNRQMREKIGMRVPDAEVGQNAYDFMALCCSIPEVVLSAPLRRENAPVVQSRWIVRLKAWLDGRNSRIASHPVMEWMKVLDQPGNSPESIGYPCPVPPLSLRPRSMSITDVERWIKNPYEIYAKKILCLEKITGIEEDRSAAIFGMVVHEGLRRAYESHAGQWTMAWVLQALLDELDNRGDILDSYKQWWRERLLRIADWVFCREKERRDLRGLSKPYLEWKGHYRFQFENGLGFTLRGRADRIDLNHDGTVDVLDYKTGTLPSINKVESGLFPQLPLEAAMIVRGGFGQELAKGDIQQFRYWQLKGDIEKGKECIIENEQKAGQDHVLSERYWQALQNLIIAYDDETQPYLFQLRSSLIREYAAQRVSGFGDYRHLARALEWSIVGQGEE